MHFQDTKKNTIHISPKTKVLNAFFRFGHQMTLNLPSDYLEYNIVFNKVEITEADMDYILQWRQATSLIVYDQSDFIYKLSQRIDEFKEFKDLKSFSFDLQLESYEKFKLQSILNGPQSLESVNIYRSSLRPNEFSEFVQKNKYVFKWGSIYYYDRLWYFKHSFKEEKD